MQSPSGILGPLFGKAGLYYIRRTRSGELLIVPRYRNDAQTPAQLKCRKRFQWLMSVASKCYLSIIKPHFSPEFMQRPPLADVIDLSMHLWDYEQELYQFVLLKGTLWPMSEAYIRYFDGWNYGYYFPPGLGNGAAVPEDHIVIVIVRYSDMRIITSPPGLTYAAGRWVMCEHYWFDPIDDCSVSMFYYHLSGTRPYQISAAWTVVTALPRKLFN